MRRRRRTEDVGTFTITSRGIEASASTPGAAISKAQTLATRVQLTGELEEGDVQSLYVRRLGGDPIARVDVKQDVIETYAY